MAGTGADSGPPTSSEPASARSGQALSHGLPNKFSNSLMTFHCSIVIASASEAIHIAAKKEWNASFASAPRNDVRQASAISRREAPELKQELCPSDNRGHRECRAPVAPATSRGEK